MKNVLDAHELHKIFIWIYISCMYEEQQFILIQINNRVFSIKVSSYINCGLTHDKYLNEQQ